MFLLPLLVAGLAAPSQAEPSRKEPTLRVSEGVYTVEEHHHTLDRFGHVATIDYDRTLERRFRSTILDNGRLRVTIVPDLGGRVVSLVDLESGHEMLYIPEVVSPYGFLPPFYYNHLKVYGGIFLSVPGPEHGKAPNLPWKEEILQTEDAVGVRVSWQDTVNIPHTFNEMYGLTGLRFAVTMTLRQGARYLEYEITVENPGEKAQKYEAWVATTVFDHDYEEGHSDGAHMVVPVDEVITKAETWPWVEQVEHPIPGAERDDVYSFDRLQYAKNYFGYYIGNPPLSAKARWWAILHPDNGTGLLSLRGDDPHPKGQKYWAWGYRIGERGEQDAVSYYPKPYLEPWVGVSEEFGEPYEIGPGETQQITLAFYPLASSEEGAEENVLLPSRKPAERLEIERGSAFPDEFSFRYTEPFDPHSLIDELDQRIEAGFEHYPADEISLLFQGGYYDRARELIRRYRNPEVKEAADQMMLQVLLMDDELAAAEAHFETAMGGTTDEFVAAASDFYAGWNDQTAKILHLDDYVVATRGRDSPLRVHVLDYLSGKPGFRNPLNRETRKEILEVIREVPGLEERHRYYRAVVLLEEGEHDRARRELIGVLAEATDEAMREDIEGYLERIDIEQRISRGELPIYRPIFPQLGPGESLTSYPWELDD